LQQAVEEGSEHAAPLGIVRRPKSEPPPARRTQQE
jgi:hypothetical protein